MIAFPVEGGCQCEALRYALTQAPLMVYNCHCTNCRKIGGGAFATPATIAQAALSFTRGTPRKVEWKSDAGNLRFGWYCGDCGTRIAHGQVPSIGMLSLRTGTLDDTSWVEPVGDIWTRSALPWVDLPSTRLRTEGQPTDYGPFVERYRAQSRFEV